MITTANNDTRPTKINPVLHPVYRVLDFLATSAAALEHWRQRELLSMQLAHVDTRTLRDAGISKAQRFIGVNHPFE